MSGSVTRLRVSRSIVEPLLRCIERYLDGMDIHGLRKPVAVGRQVVGIGLIGCRTDDDGRGRPTFAYVAGKLNTVHGSRHLDVGKYEPYVAPGL